MALPKKVTVCECWALDGLQAIPLTVQTDLKLEMINSFIEAGVRKMEVTSFSHPKLLPQFADCVEILRRLDRKKGVTYVVLMPNEKGFERFETCTKEGYGADEMILMISASEAHNKVNFRMDHPSAKKAHAKLMKRARDLGVRTIGCTGTVYGCPISGDVPMEKIVDITRFYIEEGAHTLMLGDTTGAANPIQVRERIGELISLFPKTKFIAHFHDTRGTGVLNTYTALELGLEFTDSSIGAIGGQPSTKSKKYQGGHTGNTCTEDLVGLLAEVGVETGIDLKKTIVNGHRAEEIIGRTLRANVIHSGPVSHQPQGYQP